MRPFASQSALQPDYGHALYRAWGRVGLLVIGPRGAAMTLILIGLGSGGCSLSRPDAYARMDAANVTGSLSKQPGSPAVPTESDLAFARTAASDVLTKGDQDSSHRRARLGDAAVAGLFRGRRTHLPGFPGKLRQRPRGKLVAGRGLQGQPRPMGNPHDQALDEGIKPERFSSEAFGGSCKNATGSPDEAKAGELS